MSVSLLDTPCVAAETGTPTSAGAGYLCAVRTSAGMTAVTHARSTSPLRLFTPRAGRRSAWVVSTTLGGGLVGGDDINIAMDVGPGAQVLFTTQSSTKVYRSARPTRQRLSARVEDDGLLAVLPDPIAAFAGSSFEQQSACDLGARANLLIVDWLQSGRPAYGDEWAFDHYASRFQIRRSGRLVFADHLRLNRADGSIARRMCGFTNYALLIASGPVLEAMVADLIARVTERTPTDAPLMAAAPLHDGSGVVVRIAGHSVEAVSSALRQCCQPVLALLGEDPWASRW